MKTIQCLCCMKNKHKDNFYLYQSGEYRKICEECVQNKKRDGYTTDLKSKKKYKCFGDIISDEDRLLLIAKKIPQKDVLKKYQISRMTLYNNVIKPGI